MTSILTVNSSATINGSSSRALVGKIVKALNVDTVIDRDLKDPLSQVTDHWVKARLVDPAERSEADNQVLTLSDTLIDELNAADTIVIGMPMYNFGIRAALKLWVDLICRPKVTFRYTENGPEGLLKGKRAIIAMAAGGVPKGAPVDFASPHMETVLKFIGITDITCIDARDEDVDAQIAAL